MILVDSNILMYAAGAPDRRKAPSAMFLEQVARAEVDAAVDADVLQEVLHRYRAIWRWKQGRGVFDLTRRIFPLVIPITVDIVEHARALMDEHAALWARDAVHAAVVRVHGLEAICSYDRDFDRVPGLRRIEPGD